jgi:hypothetical protein
MKVAPTLAGGLKIEAEAPGDWEVLHWIMQDAARGAMDLAERLGKPMRAGESGSDWETYVVPDLRAEFSAQMSLVEKAIAGALEKSAGGPGEVFIARDEVLSWFGALNQARLGLEERYKFGEDGLSSLAAMGAARRSGFLRGRFYAAVQEIMLAHLM